MRMSDDEIKVILERSWKQRNPGQQVTQTMIISFRDGLDFNRIYGENK